MALRKCLILFGAEGETRTRTDIHPLDPEPSASTSSATSARRRATFSTSRGNRKSECIPRPAGAELWGASVMSCPDSPGPHDRIRKPLSGFLEKLPGWQKKD